MLHYAFLYFKDLNILMIGDKSLDNYKIVFFKGL